MLFKSLVTALLAAGAALAQTPELRVETPQSAVVCRPLLINFSGGEGPYFLTITLSPQTEIIVHDFDEVESGPQRWLVNVAPNTNLVLNLRDQTGLLRQSAPFPVQPGPNTDCVGQEPSETPTDDSGPRPTGGSTGAPSPTRSPTGSGTGTGAGAPAATSPGSNAVANAIPAALAGVLGAAAVLLV